MPNDSHLYLDVQELRQRGWTEALIKRFLGEPDRWKAVDHWANYTGKRTYFLERVHLAEASDEFCIAFVGSTKRRKLTKKVVDQFLLLRKSTSDEVRKWRESLTEDDIKVVAAFEKAARILEESRRRGYRTPHKA